MGDWFQATAGSGSMLLAIPVAVVAGLVSFFSPCVIPLLPGYLSYATGLSGADLAEESAGTVHRGRMVAGSTLFVLGFSVVFVGLGVLSASVSRWFFVNQRTLTIVLGLLAILLGLAFMGLVPFFQRDFRDPHGARGRARGGAAARLPVRPGLDPLHRAHPRRHPRAGRQRGGSRGGGAARRSTRSGSGCRSSRPALAWRRAIGTFAFIRRHQQGVTRIGGLMLIVVGVMLLTGWWDLAVRWLQINLVNSFEVSV